MPKFELKIPSRLFIQQSELWKEIEVILLEAFKASASKEEGLLGEAKHFYINIYFQEGCRLEFIPKQDGEGQPYSIKTDIDQAISELMQYPPLANVRITTK